MPALALPPTSVYLSPAPALEWKGLQRSQIVGSGTVSIPQQLTVLSEPLEKLIDRIAQQLDVIT
jgi:hypothetical protein